MTEKNYKMRHIASSGYSDFRDLGITYGDYALGVHPVAANMGRVVLLERSRPVVSWVFETFEEARHWVWECPQLGFWPYLEERAQGLYFMDDNFHFGQQWRKLRLEE